MIEIKFKPKELELSVTGHAGAAEKGKDIVCSAVSALFYALVQSVIESSEMLEETPEIVVEDGNGFVSCKPKEGFLPTLQRTYWTILNGYEVLAAEYSEYINFTMEVEFVKHTGIEPEE
ncbi:MAG: ribosomal-processing cysteine protease Prp [Lachnospiraceae bacterium]|nr:ribosomal-processing cysteine protease Prp [Lachnospiraceae bacterium]